MKKKKKNEESHAKKILDFIRIFSKNFPQNKILDFRFFKDFIPQKHFFKDLMEHIFLPKPFQRPHDGL